MLESMARRSSTVVGKADEPRGQKCFTVSTNDKLPFATGCKKYQRDVGRVNSFYIYSVTTIIITLLYTL
jgi:hypothetical protein